MKKLLLSAALAALCVTAAAQARKNVLELAVDAPGIPIQPTMYGIFLEDINFAADGGLYAEKICNRSFEYENPLQGWKSFGKVEVRTDEAPFERNPHYVRFGYQGHPARQSGLQNDGWFGIGYEKGADYKLTFWARTAGKPKEVGLAAILVKPQGEGENQNLALAEITVKGSKWARY